MWNRIKSFFSPNREEYNNRVRYTYDIGDNLFWILWWFGIFTLMFFEKC